MMVACAHQHKQKYGKDRDGRQRYKCLLCEKRFSEKKPRPLGVHRVPVEKAKLVLRLLVEGNSIRGAERVTGVGRNTICRLLVYFGDACGRFLDQRMRGLKLDHLEFDEQ